MKLLICFIVSADVTANTVVKLTIYLIAVVTDRNNSITNTSSSMTTDICDILLWVAITSDITDDIYVQFSFV